MRDFRKNCSKLLKVTAWLMLTMIMAASTIAVPSLTVTATPASDTGSTRFTLNAGQYEITTDADGFDTIQMEDFALFISPGDPMLPHKVHDVLLPPDIVPSSLDLKITSIKTRTLDGTYDIKPATPYVTWADGKLIEAWGEGKIIVDGKNINVYESDASFPLKSIELLTYSQMRKWEFARVDFIPFQYNPVSKKLTLIESVTIEISYSQSETQLDTGTMAGMAMDDIAAESFINYSEAKLLYDGDMPAVMAEGTTYDYVIITTNAIESSSTTLSSFVTHKQNLGHSVLVVTEDDFGTVTGQAPNNRAEKIRQWLIDNYATMGIEYALLIGDPHPYESESGEGDIPMKMCWVYVDQSYDCPTDYFYADLTGNWDFDGDQFYGEYNDDYGPIGGVDLAPEVYVGRIPVYDADYTTLDSILQKIIDYESEPAGSISWRSNVLLPMSFLGAGFDGAMLAEQMKDDYLDDAGLTSWRMYQQGNGACSLDSSYTSEEELRGGTVVRDRWVADDYGIVCWWAHGSLTHTIVGYDVCSDGTLMNSSYTSSLDDDHPAFTYQSSCTNGYPEWNDNLQYAILKNGGIATVGATRVSWRLSSMEYGDFDGSGTDAGIGYEYVDRLVQRLPCGDSLFLAKQSVSIPHPAILMNLYVFNLYGTPSISLEPLTPAVTSVSPNQGAQGNTLDVTITGTFLTGATEVSFGSGITINSFTVDNSTQITASISIDSLATIGARDVSVTTPIGTGTLTHGFTVIPLAITSVSPNQGVQGDTLDVTITGTSFTGATEVSFGSGITVNNFTVDSSTQITASISIDPAATIGARDVSVTKPSGTGRLINGFTVTPGIITSVNPNQGYQGETLDVTITGNCFTGATSVGFGSEITVNSFTVDSPNQITASISIDPAATLGARDVSVTIPVGTFTKTGAFTVNQAPPTITMVSPDQGDQGQTLDVTITGTYFTGTTSVNFGSGIIVNSFTVNSSTQITANITISGSATPGARDVSVYSPGGTATKTGGFTVNGTPVNFTDPNLEAAIREAIGKPTGDIYLSDVLGLTSLNANSRSVVNLTGLEYCTNLITLYLSYNQISDLSPLSDLTSLKLLDLNDNQISDISALAGLTNLLTLDLEDNQISDISALSSLTSPHGLFLHYNQISDISALAGLTSLDFLYLQHNQISDISPLSGLSNLRHLYAEWNQISDISALAVLTNLTTLYLYHNQISDISPLSGLTNLNRLYLHINQIDDVSPLSGLTSLNRLYLYDNHIDDVSPLSGLTGLTWLSLGSNQISNVTPLSGLTSLTSLQLDSNQLSDITPLSGLTSLISLDLYWNQLSNITPLSGLTNLTHLCLEHNQISDISPLSGLTSLNGLYLYDNQISDIQPLVNNPGLSTGDTVNLNDNPLNSASVNDYIPQLQGRGVQVFWNTANHLPNQPNNVSPANAATGISLTPTLQSSAFSDPDVGDTHAASQWQITTTPGDYSNPVLDSGTDPANLESIAIPWGTLSASTTYYWHVTHQDNRGDWSSWSAETSFATIEPNTITTITASKTLVESGDSVNLTVSEQNTGDDPLTNPYVEVWKDGTLLATLVAAPDSGDDGNGILDPPETWLWTNIDSGAITATTTFEALGFGTDSLGNEISYDEGYLGERDTVTVDTIEPNTITTITASKAVVVSGDSVNLTVSEQNTGDDPLTNPYVEVWKDGTLLATLVAAPDSGDDGNGILDPPETWLWTNIDSGAITATTTFEALGFGTDSLGNEISYDEGYLGERDTVTVDTIEPNTITTITASKTLVESGDSVNLTVSEQNTGDDPLTNPYVEVWKDGTLLITLVAAPDSGDDGNGILDPPETWFWTNIDSGAITITTTFEALGFGTDSLGNEISYDEGYLGERDTVTVDTIEPDQIGFYRPNGRKFVLDMDGDGVWNAAVDRMTQFGAPNNTPIIGDWNGDGTDEIGFYRPSERKFVLDMDGDGLWNSAVDRKTYFGKPDNTPIIGDWNGDGTDEIGFYRPSEGKFVLDMDGDGVWNSAVDRVTYFGAPNDTPIIGDWNGDGTDEIGFYRPSKGKFNLDMDGDGLWNGAVDRKTYFGKPNNTPIIGDWNGDGTDEIGFYRPSKGKFVLDIDGDGVWNRAVDRKTYFGAPNNTPIIGDWNGDGRDEIGFYRPREGKFNLDMDGDGLWNVAVDRKTYFGAPDNTPIIGCW